MFFILAAGGGLNKKKKKEENKKKKKQKKSSVIYRSFENYEPSAIVTFFFSLPRPFFFAPSSAFFVWLPGSICVPRHYEYRTILSIISFVYSLVKVSLGTLRTKDLCVKLVLYLGRARGT